MSFCECGETGAGAGAGAGTRTERRTAQLFAEVAHALLQRQRAVACVFEPVRQSIVVGHVVQFRLVFCGYVGGEGGGLA